MSRKILTVLFGVVAFNFLFFSFRNASVVNPLFVTGPGTVWFFLFVLISQLFLGLAFFTPRVSRKQTYAVRSSVISVLAAGLSLFRASLVDQTILGVVAAFGTLVSTYLYALTHEQFGALSEVVLLPLQLAMSWVETAAKLFAEAPDVVKHVTGKMSTRLPKWEVKTSTSSSLIRGAVLTFPFILIVGGLLVSADPIFAQFFRNLFSLQVPGIPAWLFFRVVYTGAFIVFAAPVAWMTIQPKFHSPLRQKGLKNMQIEGLMLSTSIAILLAAFLIVQFRYLFTTVPETALRQFGVQTYSEYVKRGFGELLVVSVLVYIAAGISMIIHRLVPTQDGKSLRVANVVLLSEAVIFIFSIMRRVWLYQVFHGLSRIRVYGMVFLVLMMAFTVILILRHFKQLQVKWYLIEYVTVVLVMLSVYFLNTDALIATRFKPTVNGQVDYVYLARLSPDAADGWVAAYHWAKQVLSDPVLTQKQPLSDDQVRNVIYAEQITQALYNHQLMLSKKYDHLQLGLGAIIYPELKRTNFAELSAYQRVKPLIFTSELQALRQRSEVIDQFIEQQKQKVSLDRSSQSPLVK